MARKRKNTKENNNNNNDNNNRNPSSKENNECSVSANGKVKGTENLQQNPEHNLEPCVTESCVLPSWTPLLVSLVTLVFRVYHVIDPANWWILHPDEIFQSMEVAHSELYGYGLRPFEYNRPPKGDNLSHYEARELSLGMYALRSPIQPEFLVLVVWILHIIGLEVTQPYVIFRLSHVMLTSTLPLAVSKFTFATTQDPDVASLAAILTGASAYLNVMGTHTIVNSFVSPAIFVGLVGVMNLIHRTKDEPKSSDGLNNKHTESIGHLLYKNTSTIYYTYQGSEETMKQDKPLENVEKQSIKAASHINPNKQGKKKTGIGTEQHVNTYTIGKFDKKNNNQRKNQPWVCLKTEERVIDKENNDEVFYDERWGSENHSSQVDQGYVSKGSRNSSEDSFGQSRTHSSCTDNNSNGKSNRSRNSSASTKELSTSFDSCCVNDISDNSNRSRNSSASTVDLSTSNDSCCTNDAANDFQKQTKTTSSSFSDMPAQSEKRTSIHKTEDYDQDMRVSLSFIYGFFLAIAVYIRPDAIVFVSAILFSRCFQIRFISLLFSAHAWCMIIGAGAGLVVGVANDVIFYDGFILSPINWLRFNIWNNMASELFGTSRASFYLNKVFFDDWGMILLSMLLIISFVKACTSTEVFVSAKGRVTDRVHKNNDSDAEFDFTSKKDNVQSPLNRHYRSIAGSLPQNALCTVTLTALYSYVGHKEERFLHDVVVLFLITASEAFLGIINSTVGSIMSNKIPSLFHIRQDSLTKTYRAITIALFVSVFAITQTKTFSTYRGSTPTKQWMFSSPKSGQDTTSCLHFLSRQPDVTGVYIEQNFPNTGGYTVLHKNVPLIFLFGQVFLEFTNSSKRIQNKPCAINHRKNKLHLTRDKTYSDNSKGDIKCNRGFYSITTVSDLAHKDNTKALLKKIVGLPDDLPRARENGDRSKEPRRKHRHFNPRYNYAIVAAGKQFLSPAFRVVFRTQSMWLWRREGDPNTEAWLQRMTGQNHHVTSSNSRLKEPATVADETTSSSKENQLSSTRSKSSKERQQSKTINQCNPDYTNCEKSTIVNRFSPKSLENVFGIISKNASVTLTATSNITSNVSQSRTKPRQNHSQTKTRGNQSQTKTRETQSQSKPLKINKANVKPEHAHKTKSIGNNANTKEVHRTAAFLEYEAEDLKHMGNYWEAYRRFRTLISMTTDLNKPGRVRSKAAVLASAAYCLYRMGEMRQMNELLTLCMTSYSRDQCLNGGQVRIVKIPALTDKT